jgi:hypothetical protein
MDPWWRASGAEDDVGQDRQRMGQSSGQGREQLRLGHQRLAFQPDALEAERRVGVCEVLGPIRWRLIQSAEEHVAQRMSIRKVQAAAAAMNRQSRRSKPLLGIVH